MSEKVLLLGASGAMGLAAFRELWARKGKDGKRQYDLVLLLRSSRRNKELFAPYDAACGIRGGDRRSPADDPHGTRR